jgi:hypothetical protein
LLLLSQQLGLAGLLLLQGLLFQLLLTQKLSLTSLLLLKKNDNENYECVVRYLHRQIGRKMVFMTITAK